MRIDRTVFFDLVRATVIGGLALLMIVLVFIGIAFGETL
jgi:hypothetical protein